MRTSCLLPIFPETGPPMRILLVKTSSLGDVIHNLPVLSDLRHSFPEASIDWCVEEAFADLPRLHPAVAEVIPVALRRWRKNLGKLATNYLAFLAAALDYGSGRFRKYLHDDEEAAPFKQEPGTFTPWADLEPGTDLLFYEGLHGAVVTEKVDVAQHADLLIGVVPVINLEWTQKIHRDKAKRGYSTEAVTQTILRRMDDYVNYMCPQFSRTHVNFQRVPVVDTSNPFIARTIPTPDESMLVIRFANPNEIDFPYLLSMLSDSFMSRPNTIVCPGGKMDLAMQLIFTPMLWRLLERRKNAR